MARGRTVGRQAFLRIIAALFLAAFVTACTTVRAVDAGASGAFTEEVRPSDWVAVTTHDGRELLFEVVRVEPEALIGTRERVARDEVAQLEVRRLDAPATAALTAGGGVALLLTSALLVATAGGALAWGAW